MQRYTALLRGINVSGQKMIKMAPLKREFENLGFENVVTYLQSGNVVFDAPAEADANTASDIAAMIEEIFGFRVSVFLRSISNLEMVIAENPFVGRKDVDEAWLYVTFLDHQPDVAVIVPPAGTIDQCELSGDVVYLYCPKGYGTTKLNNNWFERQLKAVATTRNWKTVNALTQL